MANTNLKECRECKKPVSRFTQKCPDCGISSPAKTAREIAIANITAIAGIVLLIIGIAAYFSYFSSEDTSKTDATIKTVEQIRIEDEKIMIEKQLMIEQEQNRIERQFSAWDGRHIKLYKFIKENLNDPDSLQHIETRYWKNFDENDQFNNTIMVETKYRAKNSFGGYVVEYISADYNMNGNMIKINSPTD